MKKHFFFLLMGIASIVNAQMKISTYGTDICNGDSATLWASSSWSLASTFAAGNNHRGNMFDIGAINDVLIDAFDVHPQGNTTIAIFYKVGSFVGSEANAAAWTFIDSVPVNAQPTGIPTRVPINVNIAIPAGQTYAFYVTSSDVGVALNYTNGTTPGAVFASDANLQFLEGVGLEYPFTAGGGTFSPRVWNGNIHYSLSTDTILWNTGDTTRSIVVRPTDTTTYSVTVNGSIDSVTINNNTSYSSWAEVVCDSFVAPSGAVYFASQIFNDTIPNTAGCDSIITIDLTILNTSSSSITEAVCDSFVSPSGVVYFDSQIFNDTIPNTAGCDSVITIDLTVGTLAAIDTTVNVQAMPLIQSNDTNSTYQWIDCDNNNTTISGATNQAYTATANGNYAVQITKDGCVDTSACVTVSGVGVSEIYNQLNISVYPNPTEAVVSLDLGIINNAIIKITDINGKVLKQILSNNQIESFDFEVYPTGLYFINVTADSKTSTLKVMKQ